MRILVCYSRFPWPLNKGDSLTVFKLLAFLSERHQVDFLTVAPADPAKLDRLPPGLNSVTTVRNPMPKRLLRLMRALLGDRSLQVDSFFSPAYAAARDRLLRSNSYDVVYSHYIRSFGHDDFDAGGARRVIGLQLSHQAHFAKAAKRARNPLLRWLYALETRRLEKWEGRIADFNDLIHLISPRDLARIRHHQTWQSRVFFNPHGVDPDEFVPAPSARVPERVIFTGNLGFQANEDAVLWLTQEIWPRVTAARPSAHLLVAGARPTPAVRAALARSPRAQLLPFPPRMAPVIQTGDVSVDPLRIGAGLQNKVLESMACAVPVVATSLANEGIGAQDGSEIIIADDAAGLAEAVIRLLENPVERDAFGANARAFVEQAWSWEHHFGMLEERWMELTRVTATR